MAGVCHIHHMSRPDIVLLDLDGTLTDSAPGIINCLRYALDSLDIAVPDDDTIRGFLGPPLADTFRDHFGMSADTVALAISRYRERYHDVGLFENDVYDGVPEMLAAVHDAGCVMAVATSKPTYSATRILDHFGLVGQFAFVGGADLDGVRHDKAAVIAHTLHELAARMVLGPDTTFVMVGDREHDVRGARAHGIDTIGVLWGYGTASELHAAGAVAVAASPEAATDRIVRGRDAELTSRS